MSTHLFFDPSEVLIFVEPQDIKKYKSFWPEYTFIDIEKNNQGLPYVRNFILKNCSEDKLIMSDDDISSFGVRNKEGRYDAMMKRNEFLKDIEDGLDKCWGYVIPQSGFAYFMNQEPGTLEEGRYYENRRTLKAFYGINVKKFKEHGIFYDTSDNDDIDTTIQIMFNSGNILADFMYCIEARQSSPMDEGGLSYTRESPKDVDSILRKNLKTAAERYGFEFLRAVKDKDGYLKSFYINMEQLLKRKDIAMKNYEKYLKNKTI